MLSILPNLYVAQLISSIIFEKFQFYIKKIQIVRIFCIGCTLL